MESRPIPLKIRPGVHLTNSQEASSGRFTEAQWVRFVDGLPEKIGGWEKRSALQASGIPRGCLCWNTRYGDALYAFGTSKRFYVSDADGADFADATPTVTTDFLTNAASVTNLDATVTITHTSHGRSVGDKVRLRGAKHTGGGLIGGLDLDGVWTIATVPDANTYTFEHTSNATSTVSGGGGDIFYVYSTADPFETTSGSATVTVNKTSHGLAEGQLVEISGASAVGGLTIDGVYTVGTASANEFTITAASNASSTTTGGGETVIEALLREGASVVGGGIGGGGVYGAGVYGEGPYGTGAVDEIDVIYVEPRFWSIDNYGEDLVLNPLGEGIYYYDTSRGGRPTLIHEAPRSVRFVFVTDERIVHALGIDGDPLKFAWSDQGVLSDWVATEINQASAGRNVQSGSRLLAGVSVGNGLSLLWTDTHCYIHQYTGGELVYDTRIAPGGVDGGIIGPLAFEATGPSGGVYWMSPNGFRMFDGSVRGIPQSEDVESYVYGRLNRTQQVKTAAFAVPAEDEVWFSIPMDGESEPGYYAMVNLKDYAWSFGTLTRTCGSYFDIDTQNPVWFGNDGYVYTHETGVDANGAALPWALAYAALGDGSSFIEIDSIDLDWQRDAGEITVALTGYDSDPATTIDTDTMTYDSSVDAAALQPRIHARFIKMRMTGGTAVGDDFRMGVPKIAFRQTGRRRA
jgi:hypothetical protein